MDPIINKEQIAKLLMTDSALGSLTFEEACAVACYMVFVRFAIGSVIFSANEQSVGRDYMLLVVQGDVLVETQSNGDATAVVNVLSAGQLIGELSVIDGEPRSANCTAQTEVDVALLSRKDLERMMSSQPSLGAQFCLAIAKKIADKLRHCNQKLLMMSQVNQAMGSELEAQIRKKQVDIAVSSGNLIRCSPHI
jgi:CRP-like cAMP-binding protein